ncbi:hypothetical protein D9611_011919 [Ephemerocybe angulata]|uniref:CFA20 domain-containing protein n=1 Tax=Ephemerocybe angulata TaxID=980116 RepID=A0A8H5C5Q7_9AGAR|nr:hypothetical protein D9611_011919 [Tulosesus angulatus]
MTQEMFNSAAHHPIISLFSSTGSRPLAIFSSSISHDANGLSCICLLHDGRSEPRPAAPVILLPPSASLSTTGKIQGTGGPSDSQGYTLDQTVLHLQSPDLRGTYIQCPPSAPHVAKGSPQVQDDIRLDAARINSSPTRSLGIRHPWIHLQVRNLGKDWSFEVGLVDTANRLGILRLSTFQVRLSKSFGFSDSCRKRFNSIWFLAP